jgi:hypothetical protein
VVEGALAAGVEYLSLFAFSQENWQRPATEVGALMSLLEEYIAREVDELRAQGVRVRVLGDLERLTPAAARAVAGWSARRRTTTGSRSTCSSRTARARSSCARRGSRRGRRAGGCARRRRTRRRSPRGSTRPTARPRPAHPHVGRAAHLELPALADRLRGDLHLAGALARLRPRELYEAILAYQGRERRFGA